MSEHDTDDNARLRRAVWSIINLTQGNQLFVHSGQFEIRYKQPGKKRILKHVVPEILTICVLNALVPNSAMLLMGGHGGAKTTLVKLLGRMFTGKTLDEIEDAILRGHPQLTEEKILATLDLPELMKGNEVVKWSTFVKDFWKIIDEVNRMTPYAQNILLSLLAEQRVKFYDKSQEVKRYCLYATMNPKDSGTFSLPLPFLDRFGISLPFSMPTANDLTLILKSKDTKLFGYDELMQVPAILTVEDLMVIWRLVDKQKVDDDAETYINTIIREFSLCDRINKGVSNRKRVGPELCSNCHFNTTNSVCNKVISILSVRAAKDLLRYSKALAWLLQVNVDIHVVESIAPYVIQHRVQYVPSILDNSPYYGDTLVYTRDLLRKVMDKYNKRLKVLDIMKKMRQGNGTRADLDQLKQFAKNDLVVKHDFLPVAKLYLTPEYMAYLSKIEKAREKDDIYSLIEIKNSLLSDSMLMNKSELITLVDIYLDELTRESFVFSFSKWRDQIWAELAIEFRNLESDLQKSLGERFNKQLRTRDSVIGLIISGNDDDSIVSLDVSGGADAVKIKQILQRAGVFNNLDI
ncbi:MAG: AAA family ATPase [Promethearchaeota archaeon]